MAYLFHCEVVHVFQCGYDSVTGYLEQLFSFQFTNLGAFGGTSVPQTTRLVLEALVSADLARKCNWKGKGGKVAFSRIENLAKLIHCKKRISLDS